MEVAEDPMAGPDDRGTLPLDQDAKGVGVAGEDGIDDRAVIATVVVAGASLRQRGWEYSKAVVLRSSPFLEERFGSPSSCRKASRTMGCPSSGRADR